MQRWVEERLTKDVYISKIRYHIMHRGLCPDAFTVATLACSATWALTVAPNLGL